MKNTSRGFIQIQLLIVIIASVLVTSTGAGIFLYNKAKFSETVKKKNIIKNAKIPSPILTQKPQSEVLGATESKSAIITTLPSIQNEKSNPTPQVSILTKGNNQTKEIQNEVQKIEQLKQPTLTPLLTQQASTITISALSPTSMPASTATPSYTESHCPKILKIEDNLGNFSTTTSLKGTFKKGIIDLLTVKIIASDPQNLPLYYQYSYSHITGHNPYLGNWSANNSYNVDVTNAYVGSDRVLFVSVDNQDGYGCSGAYYDTNIQFNYDITE